jgi:uncharacterized integral membrane protein
LKKRYLIFPLLLILVVPAIDESIQTFMQGRAAEFKDIGVNTLGGVCGALFAILVTGLILFGLRKTIRKEREEEGVEMPFVQSPKAKKNLKKPTGYPRFGMYYKE